MSRSSLILGFVIAGLVHAALFLPSWLSNPPPPEQTQEPPDGRVTIVVPPPPRVEPAVPLQQPPLSDALRLAEVVQPRAEDAKLPKEGETAVAAADDDQALPATRIVWESPAELRAVAREFGMRVVAVTRANEVVGEVALDGALRLAPFRLRFETYSNRVRSLPASFFGEDGVLPPICKPANSCVYSRRVVAKVDRHEGDLRELFFFPYFWNRRSITNVAFREMPARSTRELNMSRVTTNIRRLFAFVLALGVLLAPATALAGDGHHGHRGHYGHHGRHRQHGGIHLGIQFGHHGRHAGDHHSYRHHRGYPYYGYRYRFPYYRVYGGVPVYRYRDDAAKEPAADEAKFDRHVRDPDRSGLALGAAWNLLATDRPVDALHEFGRQARSNPANGMPKVGYALASAMTGDLTRSVRAMRRALRVDPHSLQYVSIDQQLGPKIEHLAHQYEQTLDNRTRNLDAAFLVASMHYLLGNTDKAHHAIERAIRDGDHSASAENLRQLIEAAVAATATHASGSDRAPVEQTTQDAAANDNARDY